MQSGSRTPPCMTSAVIVNELVLMRWRLPLLLGQRAQQECGSEELQPSFGRCGVHMSGSSTRSPADASQRRLGFHEPERAQSGRGLCGSAAIATPSPAVDCMFARSFPSDAMLTARQQLAKQTSSAKHFLSEPEFSWIHGSKIRSTASQVTGILTCVSTRTKNVDSIPSDKTSSWHRTRIPVDRLT